MAYKIKKHEDTYQIIDTKSGKSVDIDIKRYMNGGYKAPSINTPTKNISAINYLNQITPNSNLDGLNNLKYLSSNSPVVFNEGGVFPCAPNDLECQKQQYNILVDSGNIDSARNSPFFDERDFTGPGRIEKGLDPENRLPFTLPEQSVSNDTGLIDEQVIAAQNSPTVTTNSATGLNVVKQQEESNNLNNSKTDEQPTSEETNTVKNSSETDVNYNLFNTYAGVDIPTAAFTLGQNIERGNTLGTVGSGLKVATGLARNFLAGLGNQRRYNQVLKDYFEEQRDNKNPVQTVAEGGKLETFAYGGKKDEELATGEYMHGVKNTETEDFNAEIEKGEYFQTNLGDIAEVVGNKHTNGGEKILMEPEDRVLSDQLKLGAKQAKTLSEKYDIKLKAKNTYADVLDKYRKKTGLDKLIEEEAEIIKKIGEQDNVKDSATRTFNLDVLSKKRQELTEEKHPIEEARKEVFEELFERQEASKSKKDKNNEKFKKGGKKDPPEKEKDPIFKFLLNDFLDDSKLDFDATQTQTNKENTSSNIPNFGFDSSEEQKRLNQLRKNFPIEFDKTFEKNEEGNFQIIPSKEGKIKGQVLDFQKRIDENYEKLINEVAPTLDEKDKEAFIQEINNRRFSDTGKVARRFDDKLGLFTSTRTNARLPFAIPEDLEKLESVGVTTRSQLFNPDGSLKKEVENLDLDPTTLDTIDRVKDFKSNFLLGEYNLPEDAQEQEGEAATPSAGGVLLFPDETPLPPTPLQATLKNERRFDRVRPSRIEVEPYLQDLRDREAAQVQSLEGLSPNVRAAVLANLRANNQRAESDIRNRIDSQNLQSQERAIYTNANIQAREENAFEQDRLGFEQRQFRAQALTDNDINNYFNQLQALNKQRFLDVHNLNLINATNDDVFFDGQSFRRKLGSSDRDLLRKINTGT